MPVMLPAGPLRNSRYYADGSDNGAAALQWGRPPEGAEGVDERGRGWPWFLQLQWGRPPEGAEGRMHHRHHPHWATASMGPPP